MELKNTGFAPEAIYLRGVSEYQGEIGDALYICSFFKKIVIFILHAKTITNWCAVSELMGVKPSEL